MSAPDYPDPEDTAAAQTASNKETAIAQYELGATNQVTPYGSLAYEQTGTSASGTPTYTATQTLSPMQQRISNTGEDVALLGAQTAENLLGGSVSDTLSTSVDLSPGATEAYLFDLASATLDPYYEQEEQEEIARLANQGIFPGNPAYNDAMAQFNQMKTTAYNDLMLSGHQTATQDILTERNQPLTELNALMSGAPVTQPSYVSTPQPAVQPTDVAQITAQAAAAEQAQYNAILGGLFSIGTAGITAFG